MKKLLSLSLMLSFGLATVTPALNAVAESQANPADVSGWQAAKKWWRSGRNMKALNRQEKRAFRALKKKFTLGAIITAIVAIVGGGAAYLHRKTVSGAANVSARPFSGDGGGGGGPAVRSALVEPGCLGQELIDAAKKGNENRVKDLLKRGADVKVQDQFGLTALMWAAAQGYKNNIVRLLLDAGADKDMRTPGGATAEDLARASNYVLADMIRDYVSQRAAALWQEEGAKTQEEFTRAQEEFATAQEILEKAQDEYIRVVTDENYTQEEHEQKQALSAVRKNKESAFVSAYAEYKKAIKTLQTFLDEYPDPDEEQFLKDELSELESNAITFLKKNNFYRNPELQCDRRTGNLVSVA